jgi:hypothetical protein
VGDFRRHAIQLEDGNSLAARERLARRHPKIEPAEEEAFKARGDDIDGFCKRRCQQRTRVIESGAAAMTAAIAQHDQLSLSRHLIEMVSMVPQVKSRHPDRVGVRQYELLDCPKPVAGDRWQAFLGDRHNATVCVTGPTDIEHAELDAWHVLLNDRIHTSTGET